MTAATRERYAGVIRRAIERGLDPSSGSIPSEADQRVIDRLGFEGLLRKFNCHTFRAFEFDGVLYGLGNIEAFARRTQLRRIG